MRLTLRIVYFLMILLITLICGCTKDNKKSTKSSIVLEKKAVENNDPDCVEYVALWSAGDIAEKIGKDKKWVFLNYTVDLWNIPPADGDGKVVSKLRASSYARIIEKRGDAYKVESPVDHVHGWISNEHVKTISKKNSKTLSLCE